MKSPKSPKSLNVINAEHHGIRHKISRHFVKPIKNIYEIMSVSNKVYYSLFVVYVIVGFLSIKKIVDESEKYEKEKKTNPDMDFSNFAISITMFFLYLVVGSCYFVLGYETKH